MIDATTDVKVIDSSTTDSVKGSDSRPDANVIAELKRKAEEFSTLKEKVDSMGETMSKILEKLDSGEKLTKAEERVLDKSSDLADQLEKQAANGDTNAKAFLEAAEKRAERKAESVLTKRERLRDFDARDKFFAGKAKDHGMTVKQFIETIDPYARNYRDPDMMPSEQAELAYKAWQKEKSLEEREAKLKEKEIKEGNFRDDGTSREGSETGGKPKHWRDAKTKEEKMAALYTI